MNLTDFVKAVSQEDFGKSFNHVAVWNTKLRSSGGRFFPADGHLDFNPKIYDTFGLDVFRKIVRHELCHYHLYFAGKGYKHADADFKDLLKAVDGLRYALPLTKCSCQPLPLPTMWTRLPPKAPYQHPKIPLRPLSRQVAYDKMRISCANNEPH